MSRATLTAEPWGPPAPPGTIAVSLAYACPEILPVRRLGSLWTVGPPGAAPTVREAARRCIADHDRVRAEADRPPCHCCDEIRARYAPALPQPERGG